MTLLGMFARYWSPGAVKTRLAAVAGEAAATVFYRASLETLVRRFADAADQRWLVVTPAERQAEFGPLAREQWRVVPQSEGDLGSRMAAFFEQSLASGAERVVLIGSDSPTLPQAYVDDAFERLRTTEAVLGPASDGGYYLVGARRATPPIFDRMPWSSASLLEATRQRLEEHGIAWQMLPSWYDIDTWEDLEHLRHDLPRLAASGDNYRELNDALAAMSFRANS